MEIGKIYSFNGVFLKCLKIGDFISNFQLVDEFGCNVTKQHNAFFDRGFRIIQNKNFVGAVETAIKTK